MIRLKPDIGEFGKVLIRFASSQVITNILSLLAGFLTVRLLEPDMYGQFTGVGVYMGYILLGHGGILNGMNRELPYELGRNNDAYARQLASSTLVFSTLISTLAALVFLFVSIYHFLLGDTLNGFIFLSYVIIGGLYLMNKQFLLFLYRTNNDFSKLAKLNMLVGVGNLVSVVLVYLFGIYGLLGRGILLALLEFGLLMKNKPFALPFKWKKEHLRKLLHTGFPIFLVGHVSPIWGTVMNNIIFAMGGGLYYGLYALSNIIQGVVGVVPAAFGQVIYPRMTIMLGEGRSVKHILKSNLKPLYFQFATMLAIALSGTLILPIIIPWLLPKYVGGIEAAQWMLFVPVVQSFGSLNNIYNVVKKQTPYLISLIIGAVIGSMYVFFQIKANGFQLVVFPQGMLIGTAIQQLLSLSFLRLLTIDTHPIEDKKKLAAQLRFAEEELNKLEYKGLPLGVCVCHFLDRSYFGDVEIRLTEHLRLLFLTWAKHFGKKSSLRDYNNKLIYLKTGRDRHYCKMEQVARLASKRLESTKSGLGGALIVGPQGHSDLATGQIFFHAGLTELLWIIAYLFRNRHALKKIKEPLRFSTRQDLAFRIFLMRQLLKGVSITCFLREQSQTNLAATDYDRGSEASLFIAAANSLGMRTVTFQHGIISPPVGFAPVHADEIWVWGELALRQELSSGVPKEKIRITGTPIVETVSIDKELRSTVFKKIKLPEKKTIVLGLSRPDMQMDRDLANFMRSIRDVQGDSDFNYVVKVHPSYNNDYNWLVSEYGFTLLPIDITYAEFINITDILIAYNSGILAEVMHYGKAVGILDLFDELPISTYELHQHLKVPLLHHPEDINLLFDISEQPSADLVYMYTGNEALQFMADQLYRLMK